MNQRSGLILALVLSLLTMIGLGLLPTGAARAVVALMVAFIPAIYVGFAIADGRRSVVVIEILHATVFFGLALLGLWVSWWYLVVGLLAHGAWDFAHHPRGLPLQANLRSWYVPFCAAYDWLVGGFVLIKYAIGGA